MSNEELHRPLRRLSTEIEKLGDQDRAIRRRMQRLVADIERQLEGSEESEHEPELMDRLRRSIEDFEVEHPRLTGVLNRIMVELSNMGI